MFFIKTIPINVVHIATLPNWNLNPEEGEASHAGYFELDKSVSFLWKRMFLYLQLY